ncbi:MAG TPA: hypothetical protein VEZ47_11655 [Gemmatirosa sp.]|nr:hypothetical protein [Gemmatirosa sp.]
MTDRPVPPAPARPADAPDPDDKLAAYHHTLLHFPGPPAYTVDLRRPVPPDARGVFRRLGIDGPFAVLTAENPEGANAEDQPTPRDEARQERANTVRTRTLAAALEAADVDWVPVTGTAPDGAYPERCVASRSERQLALFWFDGAAFWLMPAEADGAPRRLPAPPPAGATAPHAGSEGPSDAPEAPPPR